MKNLDNNKQKEKEKEEELQILRKEVELLNNRLKKSENFKHSFLSNLRNEIVNPISGILGLSSNLINLQLSKDNEGNIHRMMGLIYEEVFHLHYHLASLIQAADIESGESSINISSIDTELLFSAIKGELKPLLDKKQCDLVYRIVQQEKFYGDRDKLKLICILSLQYILELDNNCKTIEIQFEASSPLAKFKIYAKSDLKALHILSSQDEELLDSINDIKISVAKTLIEMMGGELQVIEHESSIVGFDFTLENRKQDEEGYSETGDIIF